MVFGKHLNKYYLKYWYLFFLGIIALIAVDYCQLKLPFLIQDLVSIAQEKGSVDAESLFKIIGYMFAIAGTMFVGRFIWRMTLLRGSIAVVSDIRKDMFVHSEQMSQRYFQENKTGALMALFTNDLDTIDEAITDGTIFSVDVLFMGVYGFVLMFMENWVLGLIACIPLLLLAACGGVVGKYMELKYVKRQEAYEKLSDFAQENFTGISVIKAFVKEAHELREFKKHNHNNEKVNIEFTRFSAILDVLIELLIQSSFVLVMAIGGWYVYNGQFKSADLILFIGLIESVIWPMIAFGMIISLHSRGNASLKRISQLLDEKVEILDYFPADINTIDGEIEFKDFSFQYPEGKDTSLKNITFKINKGETIGIVGKIGCGKTTLVNVLLRLYNIEKGKVFIDGTDLMNVPLKLLRDSIGFVPQDNFLFSDKVANNISFANKELTEEQIEKAASFADVHENILGFKDGYNTMVGERGVTLSGGQKQRISIARAIVKDPAILILDDSVSAVDIKTEEQILTNIKAKRKGKTTILISSRVSTVSHLDKVLVLNNGEIEAYDKPSNLVKISPTFARMVKLQELEKKVEEGE